MLMSATTHIVNVSGGGDFSQIQPAINSSVDGDSIIVYPGMYIGGLNFNGKSLVLHSLEAITDSACYIDSTIINGFVMFSCITAIQHEEQFEIRGFSITGGDTDSGGEFQNIWKLYRYWLF